MWPTTGAISLITTPRCYGASLPPRSTGHGTGSRTFALEHMRDRRPLGEMLDVARLVTAQRRVLAAA